MRRQPLDIYDDLAPGMKAYLRNYGWHFNRKALEYAVSKMKDRDGQKAQMLEKEQLKDLLNRYGIELENDEGCDALYVLNMGRNGYFKSSIPDEAHLAMYVKDVVDDKDGYPGIVFNRWYADCVKKGIMIDWDELI